MMRKRILLPLIFSFCFSITMIGTADYATAQDDTRKSRTRENKAETKKNNPNSQAAATVVITGNVKDKDLNEGILGAAVAIEDKTNSQVIAGAYTDEEGNFKISYSTSNPVRLRVMYVGMKAYYADLNGETNFNITMESDAIGLEDVVVTALNVKQKKADLGYVVQEVSTDKILRSGEQNIVQALAAKAAGVQVVSSSGVPGASSTIIIRGQSSITGNNEALFVVDGVPIDNATNYGGFYTDGSNQALSGVAMSNRALDLNPDDIESVNILKGPAAAALYGTRAGAGTVVITTKKGVRGMGSSVSFRSSYELSEVNKLPEVNTKFSQGSSGKYNSATGRSWGQAVGTDIIDPDDSTRSITLKSYDNSKAYFQTGHSFNNSASYTGSNESTCFRISIGNSYQTGIVPNTNYSRTTARIGIDTDLAKKLRCVATANYVQSGGTRAQQGSNLSGVMLGLMRTPTSYDITNGSSFSETETKGYINPDGTPRTYVSFIDNPLWTVYKNTYNDKVDRLMGTASFIYSPLAWLEITNRTGIDMYSDRSKTIFAKGSNTINSIIDNLYFHREIYNDLLVNFKHQIGDWKGNLTLGNNLNERYNQQLYTQGTDLQIPDFHNLSNSATINSYEDNSTVRIFSLFANARIQYKDILTVQITGRSETSSTFGSDNRTQFFPSVNTSFVFSELPAYKSSSINRVLSFGKIRVALSKVGIEPRPYLTRTYYTSPLVADGYISPGIQFPYRGLPGYTLSDIRGNSKIRPENVTGFEIGTDLRFFENKFGIDFTYYREVTTNAIFQIPVPASSGFQEFVGNSGKLTNQGVEIMLNARFSKKTKLGMFEWIPEINFTKNVSTLNELSSGLENVNLGGFAGSDVRAVVGKPYGEIYGSDFKRNDKGQVIVDSAGVPILAEKEAYLGNIQPKFMMGFSNEFHLGGFMFSFLFDWRYGGKIWNGTRGTMNDYGVSKETENRGTTMVYPNSVTEEGKPNTTPMKLDQAWYTGLGGGFSGATSQFVEDATWFRLREITVAYSFKDLSSVWKHLDRIDLNFSCRNLFLITKYKGVDPETNLTGAGTNSMGMDYYNMPNTRSFMFAVNFNFR